MEGMKTIWITEEQHHALKRESAKTGQSIQEIASDLLDRGWESKNFPSPPIQDAA